MLENYINPIRFKLSWRDKKQDGTYSKNNILYFHADHSISFDRKWGGSYIWINDGYNEKFIIKSKFDGGHYMEFPLLQEIPKNKWISAKVGKTGNGNNHRSIRQCKLEKGFSGLDMIFLNY